MQMDRDQERAIEWDCTQIVNKFYNSLDARRYDDLVNCFTEDGVWKRQGNELQGRAAILSAMDYKKKKEKTTWKSFTSLNNLPTCLPCCTKYMVGLAL